ncbi:flagellar hook-basal body complex protein FliE [Rhizobium sp. RU35A]|uniref:Flagellar hook-basal body complex protein FliE n=1 Tax=Rhizobium straminoryzae TaxID=1387186 RepID=A0A549TIC2_9HYPH|nr:MULTISPECIES: flagellar hook-basal body complex protein FliE [Rhizobium]TRL42993.1 flagellar hook-basal body complex protein FliE [Rhizobium straminoryzae]SIQ02710.1 flagellar hook-basal body complex protein FliE [Rhizobium sp. RU35A]
MIDSVQSASALSLTRNLGATASESSLGAGLTGQASEAARQALSFASVMGDMASGAVTDLKQAEVKSFEGIQGKANTREVVDAVMQAEQSLQTAIAFRDKIVNAYLEITKIQI